MNITKMYKSTYDVSEGYFLVKVTKRDAPANGDPWHNDHIGEIFVCTLYDSINNMYKVIDPRRKLLNEDCFIDDSKYSNVCEVIKSHNFIKPSNWSDYLKIANL